MDVSLLRPLWLGFTKLTLIILLRSRIWTFPAFTFIFNMVYYQQLVTNNLLFSLCKENQFPLLLANQMD